MRISLANHSQLPFDGWLQRNIDFVPPHPSGLVGGTLYVVGEKNGEDTYACHFRVKLAPGESKTVHLDDAMPADWQRPAPNGLSWFGGPFRLNGVPMPALEFTSDGPSWNAHLRMRHGDGMVSEVWMQQYPGEPWATGRIATFYSDPNRTDLLTQAEPVQIQFGNGITFVEGREPWQPIMDGKQVADGQGNALPFTVFWPHHATPLQSASWKAMSEGGIGACGIQKLLPDGNVSYPGGFDPIKWANKHWKGAVERLHDYGYPVVGISPNSTQTGSQEGQIFVRGEALLPSGAGAERIAYLSACKFAQRPCHHYEEDGSPLNLALHPNLYMWNSRPHKLSKDWLGKDEELAQWNVPGGWYGPDRQHNLLGTLAGAARIYGCPMLQRLLEQHATLFLASETVDPSLITSHSGSARSPGYAGMVAVHLWKGLKNRVLADKVKQRMIDRIQRVYVPELSGLTGGLWDTRADDRILVDFDIAKKAAAWAEAIDLLNDLGMTPPVLTIVARIVEQRGNVTHLLRELDWQGHKKHADAVKPVATALRSVIYSRGAMLWQQSLGSYGIDLASTVFGVPAGRELALQAAKATIDHGWRKKTDSGQWQFFENVGYTDGSVLPESEYVEGKGVHRTGWFDHSWALPGIAVVLRHEPDHPIARDIWAQVAANGGSWVAPGVGAAVGVK